MLPAFFAEDFSPTEDIFVRPKMLEYEKHLEKIINKCVISAKNRNVIGRRENGGDTYEGVHLIFQSEEAVGAE